MRNTTKESAEESIPKFDTDLASDHISLIQRLSFINLYPIKHAHMVTEINGQITVILYQYLNNRLIWKTFLSYQTLKLFEYL